MTEKKVLVLFLDGVGLGDADPEANPFMHGGMPRLQAELDVPYLTREMAGTVTDRLALLGLDARLGVDGLPQSATGQTAILTGQNAPKAIGKHYGPYPDATLREILTRDNIFKFLLDVDQPVAFANAYPTGFLDRLARGKGRLSANAQAAVKSGLQLRSATDLIEGRAIAAFLSNDYWPEPEVNLPSLTAFEAGQQLVALSEDYTLTYFEFWYPDLLGHKQDQANSIKMLTTLDDFLIGILDKLDLSTSLFLVISDHGNFEDWTTNKHTLNPTFTLVSGEGFKELLPNLSSLLDIKPTILKYLGYL